MSDTSVSTSPPAIALPPAISLKEIAPFAVFGLALLFLFYFVGMEEGATSIVPGVNIHEFLHDGRHLLGFPCH